MKPMIGIPPDTHDGRKLKVRSPEEKIIYLWDRYTQALFDHGAVAVVLPVTDDKKIIRSMLDKLDGVMLAGGNFDVPTGFYGEEPKPWMGRIKPERSNFELALLLGAAKRDLPCLGICGGMQVINVAFGGSLYQDIKNERPQSREHRQKIKKTRTSHQVTITPGTRLHNIASGAKHKSPLRIRVNSTHHQAVKEPGKGIVVNAVATDGLIEGIESARHRFFLGVQWHPEMLYPKHEEQARIFKAFIKAAKKG